MEINRNSSISSISSVKNEICSHIEKLIQENRQITPRDVYYSLSEKFFKSDDTKYSLNFGLAYYLDNKYFGFGGEYWLAAHSMPEENQIIEKNGFRYIVIRCGIFTFSLVQITEYKY